MAERPDDTDRSFCWEPVRRVRPNLSISLSYVHRGQAEQILALHAWLAAIEEAVSGPSDEQVAHAKLAWWRDELLDRGPERSGHPIVRYLQRSGGLERLPLQCLEEELRLAAARVERSVISSLENLKDLCQRIGANQLALETAIAPSLMPDAESTVALTRLNGLVQLMREGLRSARLGLWWLPLDVSARHGVARDAAIDADSRVRIRNLFQGICVEGLSWQPDWQHMLLHSESVNGQGEHNTPSRHWLLYSRLQARQLARFHRRVASSRRLAFDWAPAGDALAAWRFARRLERAR